jgi:hypothetical protein
MHQVSEVARSPHGMRAGEHQVSALFERRRLASARCHVVLSVS